MSLFNSFTNRNNFGVMNYPMLPQAGIPPIEPDAKAFIDAAGITDGTQIGAINNLVWRLKYFGLWTKFIAIYPFVGGTATTHKFNLMFPADLDSAYRLNFVGGWTHSSTGATPNGTNGYANTFLVGTLQNNIHLSIYSRTLGVGAQTDMGYYDSVSSGTPISALRAAVHFWNGSGGSSASIVNFTTTTDARGFWIGTQRAANDRQVYRNGTSENTLTTSISTSTSIRTYFIGARNDGTPVGYSSKEFAFVSIGLGLTTTEAANFNTCVLEYQTALSRNV